MVAEELCQGTDLGVSKGLPGRPAMSIITPVAPRQRARAEPFLPPGQGQDAGAAAKLDLITDFGLFLASLKRSVHCRVCPVVGGPWTIWTMAPVVMPTVV